METELHDRPRAEIYIHCSRSAIDQKVREIYLAARLYRYFLQNLENLDPHFGLYESKLLRRLIQTMLEGPMQQVLEAAQSAEYCQTKDLEAKQKAAQEEDGWTHVHRGRRPIIPAADPQPLADELETIAAKLLTLKRKKPLAEDTTVTSLTPLELMVRIVVRKKYPTSLSEYSDNLSDLSLNTMYDDLFPIEPHPETHCPGLPKILFVGIPCGLEKSPDKHIITTTPDCWPIFSELYEWGKSARKSRIGDDEIALVTKLTTTFYDNTRSSAEKKLRQYTEDQIQRLPRDSRSEIQRLRKQIEDDCQKLREHNSSETRRHRLEGIADVRRKGLNFDYQDIQGSAFRYPGWRFYTRCYKCQAFYSFQVPDEIKAKESLDYYILRDVEYPPTQCAEVLARAICRRKFKP